MPSPISPTRQSHASQLTPLLQMHKAESASISDQDLQLMQDPFFNAGPASVELIRLVIDAIPDVDQTQTLIKEHRRELRAVQLQDEKARETKR